MAGDPQTFAELKTSVAAWLNRSDLTSQIAEFIAFAERRFNRIIVVPERETVATATMSGERLALPSDFWSLRSLFIDADPRIALQQVSPSVLRSQYAVQITGKPQVFSIIDEQFYFGPSPDDTYDVEIDYYATIPALSDSQTTNWLLTKHPDIYLYGTLLQAEAYLWNDSRLEVWKAALDEAIGELMEAGKRKHTSASPVRLRSPVASWGI
jgi:hypothetical protein